MMMQKDQTLDQLARIANVAQFVSFGPGALTSGAGQRFSRVHGYTPNHTFGSLEAAAQALLRQAPERSVNVRSYRPESPRSNEFLYGLRSTTEIIAAVDQLRSEGLYVILNETVDINDGGVSGVAQGDLVEFAPDDTPRCVERPGCCALPRSWALFLLRTIYQVPIDLTPPSGRLEFSIHPARRGYNQDHVLVWEHEDTADVADPPLPSWPNRFSRHIGDKAFGLLVAQGLGLNVPQTLVVARRIRPFHFGQLTGSGETWTRTAPSEADPGYFTTVKGWTDPFALLSREDPNRLVASILSQQAVPAAYSGAALVDADGELVIEGVSGEGAALMLGDRLPEPLPKTVIEDVRATFAVAEKALGPVRLEWVHDGEKVWVVQMHRGATLSSMDALVPGDAEHFVEVSVAGGLTHVRTALAGLKAGQGLLLVGEVGLTSHIADLVRRAGIPTRLKRNRDH